MWVSLSNMDFQKQTNKKEQKSGHSHQCSGNANAFYYVCSEFVTQNCQRKITNSIKKLYKECFHIEIENQQSDWVPHVIFTAPTLWNQPRDKKDCYCCMTNIVSFKNSNTQKIKYANVTSVTKPNLYCNGRCC